MNKILLVCFFFFLRLVYRITKPLVFRVDPERAHDSALAVLNSPVSFFLRKSPQGKAWEFLGMPMQGRVGLAAGFFKNPADLAGIGATQFAFGEVGSITLEAQDGNPQPRLFRYPANGLLLNRFGFNNPGALQAAASLQHLRLSHSLDRPIWVNIGKSKAAEGKDAAIADIVATYQCLMPFADACVINVASPNTPGLRDLLAADFMEALMEALQASSRSKPLMVKVHPDFGPEDWNSLQSWLCQAPIDAVICGNTTTSRVGPMAVAVPDGAGGVSGRALKPLNLSLVSQLRHALPPRIRIVGCGGIMDAADALAYLEAGADCVEMYTGWVYGGPGYEMLINSSIDKTL